MQWRHHAITFVCRLSQSATMTAHSTLKFRLRCTFNILLFAQLLKRLLAKFKIFVTFGRVEKLNVSLKLFSGAKKFSLLLLSQFLTRKRFLHRIVCTNPCKINSWYLHKFSELFHKSNADQTHSMEGFAHLFILAKSNFESNLNYRSKCKK